MSRTITVTVGALIGGACLFAAGATYERHGWGEAAFLTITGCLFAAGAVVDSWRRPREASAEPPKTPNQEA